ncbi:MAG: hypothetical protein IJW24_00070 [Clostridia bacterium]|nr:hypothetical protein [Clostridia bacterium]
MNKTYISPTKLACLALCCMVSCLDFGFNAMVLAIAAGACFVLGIAIVSNIEKITSNHVRFIVYALIVSGVITVLKLVFGYVGSLEFLEISEMLDFAMLAALVLGIYPIYYLHKANSKTYYLQTITTGIVFVLFAVVISSIIEILAHGSLFGIFYFDVSFGLLGSGFLVFILLALFCTVGTSIEIASAEKRRENRLLIERYKYMIRESQIAKLEKKSQQLTTDVFEVGGEK